MKKVLKSLALTGSMLAIAATAQAANTVQVTTTNPVFTKAGGCERIGSYTLKFDAGTTLTEGDFFYADLTANAKLCSTIDYVIVGNRAINATAETIRIPSTDVTRPYDADITAGVTAINGAGAALIAGATFGPLTNDIVSGNGQPIAGGNVVLHVYGKAGTNRVTVTVLGTTAAVDTLTVPNLPADVSALTLHLVDGKRYNQTVVLNSDVDNFWGDSDTDDIGLKAGSEYNVPHQEPNVEDTMCAKGTDIIYDQVYINNDSKDNFLTFSGDSVVAHIGAAQHITLESCSVSDKNSTNGTTWGYIPMKAGQGAANCSLDYENPTGYCAHNDFNPFVGNRVILKSTENAFGLTSSDRYDMELTLSTTAVGNKGAYWSTNGAQVWGFTTSQDACKDSGIEVAGPAVTDLSGKALRFANTSDALGPWNDGTSCAVDPADQVVTLTTHASGAITNINRFANLWVDLPTVVYDKGTISADNIELSVAVKLTQYPCGTQVFTDNRKLGTFVTNCPSAPASSGSTTLLFPFFPAMDASMTGWWGGIAIVNASGVDGKCTLALTDHDNDTASYETPTIKAHGMWLPNDTGATTDLLQLVTKGTGEVGNSDVSIVATCDFEKGGGFGMIGNGNEGTGYTAYVLSGNQWQ